MQENNWAVLLRLYGKGLKSIQAKGELKEIKENVSDLLKEIITASSSAKS